MNDQYPGEGQQPASEPASEPGRETAGQPGRDAASGPAPVTAPAANHVPPAPAANHAQPAPAANPAQPPVGAAPGWGAPAAAARNPQADKPWTVKRGLAVGGVAAVIAVGAGAGVYALTSSSAAASGDAAGAAGGQRFNGQGMPGGQQGGQTGGSATGRDGGGAFGPGGMGAMAGGLSAAVHADYVVLEGSTYTSMAEQLGTVSEVSPSSVTVKSTDGFTRSYALGSDVAVSNMQQRRQQSGGTGSTSGGSGGTQLSVADIVSGATVRITAAKDGSGYTAKSVMLVAATATGQSN